MHIDGNLLQSWGIEPGKTFKDAMALARKLARAGLSDR